MLLYSFQIKPLSGLNICAAQNLIKMKAGEPLLRKDIRSCYSGLHSVMVFEIQITVV